MPPQTMPKDPAARPAVPPKIMPVAKNYCIARARALGYGTEPQRVKQRAIIWSNVSIVVAFAVGTLAGALVYAWLGKGSDIALYDMLD